MLRLKSYIAKSMNKIKTYQLINILEYIKIHYPGGTMIIKKIAERPRKIDDILRIEIL